MGITTEENPIRPLKNKTVLVACSALKAEVLVSGLRNLGAEVVEFPAIEVRAIPDNTALDAALMRLSDYTWIIFTSSYGVLSFARRLEELALTDRRTALANICAVGSATAATLRELGFPVSLVPSEFVAEGIIEAFASRLGGLEALKGKQILLPRAKEARDVLPDALTKAGACVDVVPCYETGTGQPDEELLSTIQIHPPDLFVFTSSSAVSNFAAILGEETAKQMLGNSRSAVLGPITARTLASLGKQADILPRANTIENLLVAIAGYYGG